MRKETKTISFDVYTTEDGSEYDNEYDALFWEVSKKKNWLYRFMWNDKNRSSFLSSLLIKYNIEEEDFFYKIPKLDVLNNMIKDCKNYMDMHTCSWERNNE